MALDARRARHAADAAVLLPRRRRRCAVRLVRPAVRSAARRGARHVRLPPAERHRHAAVGRADRPAEDGIPGRHRRRQGQLGDLVEHRGAARGAWRPDDPGRRRARSGEVGAHGRFRLDLRRRQRRAGNPGRRRQARHRRRAHPAGGRGHRRASGAARHQGADRAPEARIRPGPACVRRWSISTPRTAHEADRRVRRAMAGAAA